MVLGMHYLSSNSVYIGCKENTIFIPVEATTPYEVISTLFEGTVCVIHYLFEQKKDFLIIITTDINGGKYIYFILVVREFPDLFQEDVTYIPWNHVLVELIKR